MAKGKLKIGTQLHLIIFIISTTIFTLMFIYKSSQKNSVEPPPIVSESIQFRTDTPHDDSLTTKRPKPKIAYIFAGGVRSFVCPKVHWSIKSHLIDSLGGDPHVFVRVAVDDNRNTKTGLGVLWKPDYNDNEVDETLKILNPRVVQNFTFSTQIEEMKRNYPGTAHTVFRENDQRRYSMFYHRCMAYKLMLQYERENHMRFDWVLLVRLDAGWLEPMLPIQSYANDRVWITETGFDLFNDQFMMIPRQFSDYLYDLNTKVKKEVYCLGGPDVEAWKCNVTESIARGRDEQLSRETINYCCKDIEGKNSLGYSERIHFRHLREGKIPVSLGRFPVFLVRRLDNKVCHPECFRIYGYNYKEYVFLYENNVYPYLAPPTWTDSKSTAISSRDRVLCYMMSHRSFPWNPISALVLHQHINQKDSEKDSEKFTLDYSKPLQSQLDHVHPSILLNNEFTETWRIHPTWNVEGCLSYSYETMALKWDFCNDHIKLKNIRYDSRQLFFLQVDPFPKLQKPVHSVKHPSTPHSFIASGPAFLNPDTISPFVGLQSNKTMRILVNHCEPNKWDHRDIIMCLTVEDFRNTARVSMQKCSEDEHDQKQLFQAVRPLGLGSNHQSIVGKIRIAAAPHLCVARQMHEDMGMIKMPKNNEFFVYSCDWKRMQNRVQFEFELINS